MPLEEVLQNEAVGMNSVSVDSQYQFQATFMQSEVNVIHKLDCMSLAYFGFLWSIPAVKTNVEINQQYALR